MSRLVHFEIHASNPEKIIEFYSKMSGWTFTAYGPRRVDRDELGKDLARQGLIGAERGTLPATWPSADAECGEKKRAQQR